MLILNFCGALLLSAPVVFGFLCAEYRRKLARARENPQDYSEKQVKRYKLAAILCGVVSGVFVLILIGLIVMIYMAVAFM